MLKISNRSENKYFHTSSHRLTHTTTRYFKCDNRKWCLICVLVIGHLIFTEKSGCGHSWMGAVPELVLRPGVQGLVAGRLFVG